MDKVHHVLVLVGLFLLSCRPSLVDDQVPRTSIASTVIAQLTEEAPTLTPTTGFTPTHTSTNTRRPTTTSTASLTRTPKPTSTFTLVPTQPRAQNTPEPQGPVPVAPDAAYLAQFVPLANEMEYLDSPSHPGDFLAKYEQSKALSTQAELLVPPSAAQSTHTAFKLWILSFALRYNALLTGDAVASAYYLGEVNRYWMDYHVYRDEYLASIGQTAQSAGFTR